jgi:cell wall-associated NlpC family hydrolase
VVASHSRGKHGKIAQNNRHAASLRHAASRHGKYFARLSRHHSAQHPLSVVEKAEIVQKIRTFATASATPDEQLVAIASPSADSPAPAGDSIVNAEAKSNDIQSEIAEAAREEQAEDGVDSSLDQFLNARSAPHSTAAADAFDPGAEVEREQDFTLAADDDHAAARSDVMAEIINWIGTRYVFGGDDRGGIDCSAFTRAVFSKAFGLELPRTAWQQSQMGESVEKEQLQFGDLVFFKTAGYAPITHVGIYIGAGLFANAACSRGVTVASLSSEYWSKHFVEARRIVSDNTGAMGAIEGGTLSSGTVAVR